MNQGATLLTLMLSLPDSQAKDRANWFTAPLVAAYMLPIPATETDPATEEIKTMLLALEAFKRGCVSWDKW